MSIILVALHKKAEMTNERPENIFSLQLLAGRLKLPTDAKTIDVREE